MWRRARQLSRFPYVSRQTAKVPNWVSDKLYFPNSFACFSFKLFQFYLHLSQQIEELIMKHTHDKNIGEIKFSLSYLKSDAKKHTASKKMNDSDLHRKNENCSFWYFVIVSAVIFILVWGLQYFLCKLFIGARSRIDMSETPVVFNVWHWLASKKQNCSFCYFVIVSGRKDR